MVDYLGIGLSVGLIVFLLAAIIVYFWRKPLPTFPTKGEELVWRHSGLMGDFRFQSLSKFIVRQGIQLISEDVDRILRKYHAHVSFWNVGIETIEYELEMFAAAVNLQPADVFRQFNAITEEKQEKMRVKPPR